MEDNGYKVLSLFDGMGCAQLAMMEAGLSVDRYVSYETDRYCNVALAHNFPWVEQRGDVFDADFTEFEGFDFLMGGSPCTYWSVAQSADRRETTASGQGWELFQQYVRALHEARPRWFIYENNKSMSRAIRDSISEAFGFEPVHIDSALVSAQHRQRLYWVGRREEDGTYSQVHVEQPIDRGILLRDVLETGEAWQDKSYPIRASYASQGASPGCVEFTMKHSGHTKAVEPLRYCPPEDYDVVVTDRNIRATTAGPSGVGGTAQGYTVMLPDSKTNAMTAGHCGKSKVIEPIPSGPVRVGSTPRPNGELGTSQGNRIYSVDGKSVTLRAHGSGGADGSNMGLYAEPLRYPEATKKGFVEVQEGECLDITAPNSQRRGRLMADKSNALTGSNQFHEYMGTTNVYEVRDGQIEIRGRKYPIRLYDGKYIIRKLTVRECMRLQTVPEWYDFSCVSNNQAYKMLGNGWTVQVVVHLIESIMREEGIRHGE